MKLKKFIEQFELEILLTFFRFIQFVPVAMNEDAVNFRTFGTN